MNQDIPENIGAQIQAYLDGELDEKKREEVELRLSQNKLLNNRVKEYESLNVDIQALASIYEQRDVPERLINATVEPKQSKLRQLLNLIGVLLFGGVGGFFTAYSLQLAEHNPPPVVSPVTAQLLQPAVLAHATYSPEIKHPVEISVEQEEHLVAWLSKRLQHRLKVPQLHYQGFELIGGRLLPASTLGAAQFMYENKQGQRLTLYVRKLEESKPDTAFSVSEVNDLSVFYWVDQYYGYALSGNIHKQELLALGELVYQQLGPMVSVKEAF